MTFDIGELLNNYMHKKGQPMRSFPIVALVILWFEARYLMFRSPKKQELEDQLLQSKLLQVCYATRFREILLFVLATTLAWITLFSFISLSQRRQISGGYQPSAGLPCSRSCSLLTFWISGTDSINTRNRDKEIDL